MPRPSGPPSSAPPSATIPNTTRSIGAPPLAPLPESIRPPSDLAAELDHARRVLSSKLTELSSLQTERERLLSRIAARDQRIRQLEAELAARVRSDARVAELESALTERSTELEKLRNELAEAVAWQPAIEDDLTKIKGIGPKFAAALHALGVRRYADIAAWTDSDVIRVAEALHVPRARIDNAGWIDAAQRLSA